MPTVDLSHGVPCFVAVVEKSWAEVLVRGSMLEHAAGGGEDGSGDREHISPPVVSGGRRLG